MSRIIGCQSLYIAPVTKDDATTSTFGTPVAIPSVIAVDITDNTENVTFYSDDTVEQVIPAFSGKEVSIELGYLSHEIEAMISGNTFEGGVFTQSANSTAGEFALLFKAPLSKGGFQFVCLYKGVLSKKEANYKTKEDSVEGQTITLDGIFMPLQSCGIVSVKANSTDEGASTVVANWFTAVYKVGIPAPASLKNK